MVPLVPKANSRTLVKTLAGVANTRQLVKTHTGVVLTATIHLLVRTLVGVVPTTNTRQLVKALAGVVATVNAHLPVKTLASRLSARTSRLRVPTTPRRASMRRLDIHLRPLVPPALDLAEGLDPPSLASALVLRLYLVHPVHPAGARSRIHQSLPNHAMVTTPTPALVIVTLQSVPVQGQGLTIVNALAAGRFEGFLIVNGALFGLLISSFSHSHYSILPYLYKMCFFLFL